MSGHMYNDIQYQYYIGGGANGHRILQEIYCQMVSQPLAAATQSNIARVHSWQTYPQTLRWRIFCEYAPFGSLDELVEASKAPKFEASILFDTKGAD